MRIFHYEINANSAIASWLVNGSSTALDPNRHKTKIHHPWSKFRSNGSCIGPRRMLDRAKYYDTSNFDVSIKMKKRLPL